MRRRIHVPYVADSQLVLGEACMWCQKRPNVVSKET